MEKDNVYRKKYRARLALVGDVPCGHCNDPGPGARYASRKGWLCGRCWSTLVANEPKEHTMKKVVKVTKKVAAKPVKKAAPVKKKVAAKKKGR